MITSHTNNDYDYLSLPESYLMSIVWLSGVEVVCQRCRVSDWGSLPESHPTPALFMKKWWENIGIICDLNRPCH